MGSERRHAGRRSRSRSHSRTRRHSKSPDRNHHTDDEHSHRHRTEGHGERRHKHASQSPSARRHKRERDGEGHRDSHLEKPRRSKDDRGHDEDKAKRRHDSPPRQSRGDDGPQHLGKLPPPPPSSATSKHDAPAPAYDMLPGPPPPAAGAQPGEDDAGEGGPPKPPAEGPNLGLSGKLAAESNKVNGVVMKWQPPPEAQLPRVKWRLYCFKGGELSGEPYYLHRQPFYLFGRDRRVVDVGTDHPSCSLQHAVLVYRLTSKPNEEGVDVAAVRPYLIDLGSSNGTYLNGERMDGERYYELLEKDMIKFGFSSREYVLLNEKSAA